MAAIIGVEVDKKPGPLPLTEDAPHDSIGESLKNNGLVDDKILRMMVKMGYKSGTGLGRSEQGIVEPLNVQIQLGKRGLGSYLQHNNASWDASLEKINVKEEVLWLENVETKVIKYEDMHAWIVYGKPLLCIDGESEFVDPQLLKAILNGKNIFDELDLSELCKARSRANPYETIGHAFFMNRAALKMANIDAATDFMFTGIDRNPNHHNVDGPYYFADVCAGPGSFTEYILWRKKWLFKGFGLTLKGEHDFKLHESSCMSGVTFQPYYGGDGNICNPANVRDFVEKVIQQTDGFGVHFMMSDGGFSVEGNENLQEVLSKQLYVCQCLVALEVVRTNGHFVTKLFDIFTKFSVGLIFLMFQCFEKIAIFKPNSSRPANSERYLICSGLRSCEQISEVRKYLRTLAEYMWNMKQSCVASDTDITEIVPLDILKGAANFLRYIVKSNNDLGKRQEIGLLKLAVFCRNPFLIEPRQEILRSQCLAYWRIPADKPRLPLPRLTIADLLTFAMSRPEFMLVEPREANSIEAFANMVLPDLRDWHYTTLASAENHNNCSFYIGLGGTKVFKLQKHKWIRVKNVKLCRGTIIYAEQVQEHCISMTNKNECEVKSLHIIDALRLGDTSLADLPFLERLNCIRIYCKAVNFEAVPNVIRIRPKLIQPLESLSTGSTAICNSDIEYCVTVMPIIGLETCKEFYRVGSYLFLKTDENQSFNSTYVLRIQLYIDDEYLDSSRLNGVNIRELTNFLKHNLS